MANRSRSPVSGKASPCTVFVPDGNNPDKNAAMRAYGAIVDEGGRDFDEARERCERAGADSGARYVHSANEPLLIAGVATYALEIFEQLPEVDTSSFQSAAAAAPAATVSCEPALGSSTRVIGVQAEQADAFTRSFRSGTRVVGESAATFAEGMATRVTFDLTFSFLAGELDDIVTLSEGELAEGVRLALRGDAQPRRGRRLVCACRGCEEQGDARRTEGRRRDEWRQSRRGQAPLDPGRLTAAPPKLICVRILSAD